MVEVAGGGDESANDGECIASIRGEIFQFKEKRSAKKERERGDAARRHADDRAPPVKYRI